MCILVRFIPVRINCNVIEPVLSSVAGKTHFMRSHSYGDNRQVSFNPRDADSAPVVPIINLSVSSSKMVIGADHRTISGCTKFATAAIPCLAKLGGKWYFEVELVVGTGIRQIGWASKRTRYTSGNGCGDDSNSWGWDGKRIKLWNGSNSAQGKAWSQGDVVGCAIDFTTSSGTTMMWSLNGNWAHPMGAFVTDASPSGPLFPAMSINDKGDVSKFNISSSEFKFAPPDSSYRGVLDGFGVSNVVNSEREAEAVDGHGRMREFALRDEIDDINCSPFYFGRAPFWCADDGTQAAPSCVASVDVFNRVALSRDDMRILASGSVVTDGVEESKVCSSHVYVTRTLIITQMNLTLTAPHNLFQGSVSTSAGLRRAPPMSSKSLPVTLDLLSLLRCATQCPAGHSVVSLSESIKSMRKIFSATPPALVEIAVVNLWAVVLPSASPDALGIDPDSWVKLLVDKLASYSGIWYVSCFTGVWNVHAPLRVALLECMKSCIRPFGTCMNALLQMIPDTILSDIVSTEQELTRFICKRWCCDFCESECISPLVATVVSMR